MASDELVGACIDQWRPILKDPQSAYPVGSRIDEVTNLEKRDTPPWKEIVVDGRAKNSFGGYIPATFGCGLSADGQIDAIVTEGYKALYQLNVKFDRGDLYVRD
ncbi:MAG: hypothetical protein QM766_06235 [Burkholderiaceae bacterium]